MRVGDILGPQDVLLDFRAADKRRLIDEVARLCAGAAGIGAAAIADALNARERLGSTGMGLGIAIPHARLPQLSRPVGLFVRLRQPVDFDSIDGDRVDLVFPLLLPAQGEHVNALACVARRLRDERARASLRRARDRAEAYAVLAGDAAG